MTFTSRLHRSLAGSASASLCGSLLPLKHPASRSRAWRCQRRLSPPVPAKQSDDGAPSTSSGGLDPALEAVVPSDQRPINELEEMRGSFLLNWALLDGSGYGSRLGAVWLAFCLLLTGPISAGSFDPARQPVEFILGAAVGGLLVLSLIVLRLYLAWGYVGNRLLSATVEYEESGWADGQIFVKPPQVLARDRLVGNYTVKPVLARLRQTLVASAGALGFSALLLTGTVSVNGPLETAIPKPREFNSQGVIFSDKVKSLDQLYTDDEAAEAEAAAAGGVPGYCADRYLRAKAGGQYCKKFDMVR